MHKIHEMHVVLRIYYLSGDYCHSCSDGWVNDCYDIDHCYGGAGVTLCQNGATCNNRYDIGTYTCSCHADYTGRNCEVMTSLAIFISAATAFMLVHVHDSTVLLFPPSYALKLRTLHRILCSIFV